MKEIKTIFSQSELETFNFGKELSKELKSGMLIGLSGDLGAGKTVLVKGIAEGLEIKELITSPTFLGITENYSGKIPLIHMDFYMKVQNEELVLSYLKKGCIVVIEWIENFKTTFNTQLNSNINIYIEYDANNDNKRKIKFEVI